jgi:molybdopterin-guanine dinucleotide biosynthesis protein A
MQDVTAFILAGGRSSRMGADKPLLEFNGETLLGRILLKARRVAGRVCILGPREKFELFGPVIEDVYPDRGPLAGIHAGLAATTTELNLMLAVDLPFVPETALKYLVDQARGSDAVVTVPRVGGFHQTLCAVYRREFVEIAEESLRQGRNKIDPLYALTSVRVLGEEELAEVDIVASMFDNLNTPQDLERAMRAQPARST